MTRRRNHTKTTPKVPRLKPLSPVLAAYEAADSALALALRRHEANALPPPATCLPIGEYAGVPFTKYPDWALRKLAVSGVLPYDIAEGVSLEQLRRLTGRETITLADLRPLIAELAAALSAQQGEDHV